MVSAGSGMLAVLFLVGDVFFFFVAGVLLSSFQPGLSSFPD